MFKGPYNPEATYHVGDTVLYVSNPEAVESFDDKSWEAYLKIKEGAKDPADTRYWRKMDGEFLRMAMTAFTIANESYTALDGKLEEEIAKVEAEIPVLPTDALILTASDDPTKKMAITVAADGTISAAEVVESTPGA